MDDNEKAKLARQGLEAAELLEPGAIKGRIEESARDKASDVALRGLAALGRLTGRDPKRSPARARAVRDVDVSAALDAIDADDLASFEARLRTAAARQPDLPPPPADDGRRLDLAELRRTFPEEAQELALLVFNCVDLLDELSGDAEGSPPSEAELIRKEKLLARIAQLLAPRAGEALTSFVGHVVDTSRRYRTS